MFSKPILIAASVASAEAALLTVGTAAQTATDYSDAVGCGACLEFTGTKWVHGGGTTQTYLTETAANGGVAIAVATTTLTGGVCCSATTTVSSGTPPSPDYCAAYGDTTNNTEIALGSTDFFQAAIAQCPHITANCTNAATDSAGTALTDQTSTDGRFINLDTKGNYVTLTMVHQTSTTVGTTQNLATQRIGDVCSWIVEAKCDAPVLTIPSDSGTVSTAAEIDLQVMEWTEEFLDSSATAATGTTWAATAMQGSGTNKWYPPTGTSLTSAITDLQATAVETTAPNNLSGDVGYNRATGSSDATYELIPGCVLKTWITWLESVYTSYNSQVTTYDTERTKWTTYAEYEAPAAGLFGPTEDPDAPAEMSAPRAPTQPVAVPDSIANLSTAVTSGNVVYSGKAGYGYPSAYKLTPVASNSGKPFGTLAGGSQAAATTTAWATADASVSMRKTTNKDSSTTDGYLATCNKSYLFITAINRQAAGTAALTFKIVVTAEEFASTLSELVPTRPGAATATVAAPAGAAQLAASAVAAALTALYLF